MSDQHPKRLDAPKRPPRAADAAASTRADQEFENLYREAYKRVDHAITLVTEARHVEANKKFEEGLRLLDEALSVKIESFDVSAEQIQLYAEMQQKMRCTRKEVQLHFSESQVVPDSSSAARSPPSAVEEAPPSYDDYLESLKEGASLNQEVCYPTLNPLDFQVHSPLVSPVLSPQNGEMIFEIKDGVQIFFIYANGRVTSPSYPSFLAVFTFPEPICSDATTGSPGARGFLQVGEWSYPLMTAQSPVLHSFYGAYMFPDPANPEPGTSVGILIPDTVDKETKELFEQILAQMTSYQEQEVPQGVSAQEEKKKINKSASKQISEGAQAVSHGIIWGAEKLSELITYSSEKLKSSIVPENQHRPVDPKWQSTASVARNVSSKAVKVSGFLLSQVGKATMALGKRMAPTLQKQGTKAVGVLTGQGEKEAHSQVEGVMEVAAGAVKGASTIYMSLEMAAANLATSLADNTVKVVAHKYGPEYGALTDNTLYAVGQTAMAGHNISSLGVKGIAKRTAKDTGKALVETYEKKKVDGKAHDGEEAMEAVGEGEEAREREVDGSSSSKCINKHVDK